MKRVWTFDIRGGEPFSITLPGGPPCKHDGGHTVWKLMGTMDLCAQATGLMRSLGATVVNHMEEESPEQTEERKKLLGLV